MPSLDVSVVICTFNRSVLLRQTLARMRQLVVPAETRWELLVVDNNSTDDTSDVARSFEGQLPVRVLREPRAGRAWALNRSLDEAKADLIVWTDDDVLVGPDWLAAFLRAAAHYPDASVFGGPIDPWFPERPDPILWEAFPVVRKGFCGVDYGLAEGPIDPPYRVHGANMAGRRSRLGSVRYDVALGPKPQHWMGNDDTSFVDHARAAGGHVVWVPGMRVEHYVAPHRLTLSYLREFYEGLGRSWIRDGGIPGGRRVAGVPFWIWQQLLWHRVTALATRPRSRVLALEHLRDAWRLTGAVREARAMNAERRAADRTEA